MRFIVTLIGAVAALLVVAVALGSVLVVTGDPQACVDRTVPVPVS